MDKKIELEGAIHLDEHYFITKDGYNWMLRYRKEGDINPKTGKPKISKDVWFCSNIKLCLKRYLDEALRPSNDIPEILNRIDKVEQNIDSFYNKIINNGVGGT